MPMLLYPKIKSDLLEHNKSFRRLRRNGIGHAGFFTDKKLQNCLQWRRTGTLAGDLEDTCGMLKETIRIYFIQFCRNIELLYCGRYLDPQPNLYEMTGISKLIGVSSSQDVLGPLIL